MGLTGVRLLSPPTVTLGVSLLFSCGRHSGLLFLMDFPAATPQLTGESTFSFITAPTSKVTHLQIHPGSSQSICCNFYLGPGGKASYLAGFK